MNRLFHNIGYLFLLAFVQSCFASVLHVPDEYPSIQSALDATADGDTVLVAAGIYVESLIAPQHSFSLMGETIPDSSTTELTVLDATSLPGSDSLATLTISSGITVHLRNLVIRNGPEMRNRIGGFGCGGVINHSQLLTVDHCNFDSVSVPIGYGAEIRINDCVMVGAEQFAVFADLGGHVIASNSLFDGTGFYLVCGGDGTIIESCQFRGHQVERLFFGTSGTIQIDNCVFGPSGGTSIGPVYLSNPINSRISNCFFQQITDADEIIEISSNCGHIDYVPITISDNLFTEYGQGNGPVGVTAIHFSCQEDRAGYFGIVEDNIFMNGRQAQSTSPTGAYVVGSAQVARNRFINLEPPNAPVVDSWRAAFMGDSLILRDNLFEPEGLSVMEQNVDVDARWNWWGDASGPFHAVDNPDGLGAEVGNGVEFIPWWADTNFTEAVDARIELPQEFSLEVYPNPFNASTRIAFTTTKPGIYGLDVVNLLGQKVKEIWSGPVAYEQSWRIDLGDLSSGVYFARVRDTIYKRPVALTKLILLK